MKNSRSKEKEKLLSQVGYEERNDLQTGFRLQQEHFWKTVTKEMKRNSCDLGYKIVSHKLETLRMEKPQYVDQMHTP